MIPTAQLQDLLIPTREVVRVLESKTHVDRNDIGRMRMELTRALAVIHSVERLVVGVPKPKRGE